MSFLDTESLINDFDERVVDETIKSLEYTKLVNEYLITIYTFWAEGLVEITLTHTESKCSLFNLNIRG